MYMIVTEDDDGVWYDDPVIFYTQAGAREAVLPPPPKGHAHVLYSLDVIDILVENTDE